MGTGRYQQSRLPLLMLQQLQLVAASFGVSMSYDIPGEWTTDISTS
jgi:hypothetical protein